MFLPRALLTLANTVSFSIQYRVCLPGQHLWPEIKDRTYLLPIYFSFSARNIKDKTSSASANVLGVKRAGISDLGHTWTILLRVTLPSFPCSHSVIFPWSHPLKQLFCFVIILLQKTGNKDKFKVCMYLGTSDWFHHELNKAKVCLVLQLWKVKC